MRINICFCTFIPIKYLSNCWKGLVTGDVDEALDESFVLLR